MQFSTSIATFLLAITASAAPPAALEARDGTTTTTSGDCGLSLYSQDTAAKCNGVLSSLGACGLTAGDDPDTVTNTLPIVAMAKQFMTDGSLGHYPKCGKKIAITFKGITVQAIVGDLCESPTIDICGNMWTDFGGNVTDPTNMEGASWTMVD